MLLTRPEAQSRAFAAMLTERFGAAVRPVVSPLMAPVFLTPDLPEAEFAAVIFTSATAVEAAHHLAGQLPPKAYCVGRQTAAQAKAAGFEPLSADGNADDLVAMIIADRLHGHLLHLRGEVTRGAVAERLISAGIETFSLALYRQEPRALTTEALVLLAQPATVIVPLFSPRSATLLQAAIPQKSAARLCLAVMSSAVAEAAAGITSNGVEIARRMDAKAMLEAVRQLLDLPSPP